MHWWTFAGGIANAILAGSVPESLDAHSDNLSIRFQKTSTVEQVEEALAAITEDAIHPAPNQEAIESLKFSESLSPQLAAEAFLARFSDANAIHHVLHEQRKVVVEN